ncbi:MBL fold metallo-hydrolase [Bacillus sp. RO3]|nr:MBL fold metallo-hydrolase [Bacillus sp. RO3]
MDLNNHENVHIRVGSMDLTVLSDGVFPVCKDFFFAETPEEMIVHIRSEFQAPINFLFIDTGEKKILVDGGFGEEYLPKSGQLLKQLKSERISPEDIHTVIITHGHLDHIGGLAYEGHPVFPNALHIIREEEWNYWMEQKETKECSKLAALKDHISLVSSDIEIHPGIFLQHTPGHTDGHLVVSIKSEGSHLLIASDILNDPSTINHPTSYIRAEVDPEKGMLTRKSFMKQAYNQSALVFACHYPFPGLGYIEKENKGWKWSPVQD